MQVLCGRKVACCCPVDKGCLLICLQREAAWGHGLCSPVLLLHIPSLSNPFLLLMQASAVWYLLLHVCCLFAVVFWGGPIMQLCEFLRSSVCSVSIKALRPATTAEIERMHGDCAICWCEMTVAPCTTNASSNSSGGGSGSGSSGAAAGAPPEASASAAAAAGKHALQNAATGSDPPVCSEVPVRSSSSRAAAAGCESGGGAAGEPGAGCSVDLMVPPGSPTPLTHGYTLPCGHAYHKACLNQVGQNGCSWMLRVYNMPFSPCCPSATACH